MSDPRPPLDSHRLRERARLLEFLKFRVLASQEAFFADWLPPGARATGGEELPCDLDLQGFRSWLTPLWPAASGMAEGDLRLCLEQALRLYVDSPGPHGR